MKRRDFLRGCIATGLAAAVSSARGNETAASDAFLSVDPHAHPYQLFGSRSYDRTTPTIEIMREAKLALCSFSAVGDLTYMRGRFGAPFPDTLGQLGQVRRLTEKGGIPLVLKAGDLPAPDAPVMLRALMAVEGGDALEGDLGNLSAFHDQGVRLLTLMHERDNELAFNQRSNADGPLTPFGIRVVERMNALGMVIDVAHAKAETLKSIVAASARPVIDSHTSAFLPGEEGQGSRRLRTWQEMELIAGTGGVVCTWPLAYVGRNSERTTLGHWAEETVRIKARLGIEHVGLGTDSGGGLPRVVSGWSSQASLPALIAALREAGLSQTDIAAYVGGNILRVLRRTLA